MGFFLTQTPEGDWAPGIGDPTPLGWFTVFAYLVAAVLCFRAWQRARRGATAEPRLAFAWGCFAVLMLALGINKQLDLQTLLTVVGRRVAQRDGWYERRQVVQRLFIHGLLGLASASLLAGFWFMRKHLRELWLAGFGAIFIATFVLIRAASFHHVDILLDRTYLGARVNWILELGGIACVAAGARLQGRRQ